MKVASIFVRACLTVSSGKTLRVGAVGGSGSWLAATASMRRSLAVVRSIHIRACVDSGLYALGGQFLPA